MILKRGKEELSVMEAVQNLSNMSEIEAKPLSSEEKIEEGIFEEESLQEINWKDPKQVLQNEELIRETFLVLHKYLQNIVRQDSNLLKDAATQRGIQAIMLLATEAVQKMDRFISFYPDTYKPISKCKEFTDLQKYYRQYILKQIPEPIVQIEGWEQEAEKEIKEVALEKQRIQDLEAVQKDQNYELFFIKGENEQSFFSRSLLRHIRLIGNFDELVNKVEGEDPLLKVRELFDREIKEGAQQMLQRASPYIDPFYHEAMKQKDRPLVSEVNKALMALRMASNPVNLIENQSFKSCLEYFADFHRFLREAMSTSEYQKYISREIKEDAFSHILLQMIHALCSYFFMRLEPLKETLKLIHKILERGDALRAVRPKELAEKKELQIWKDLLDADESMRYLLHHYPNGPLLRTLDAFREEEEYQGWDPLSFYNFPSLQFTFFNQERHISVLRIPCPVHQKYIHKADIVPEFEGCLRFYHHEQGKNQHLFINLQNRTSWEEFARCLAIEDLAHKAEHYDTLHVLGLPKSSSFYLQEEEYQSLAGAPVFIEAFEQQLAEGAACGFYLSKTIQKEDIKKYTTLMLKEIHDLFFDKKTTLHRKERHIFIEIFYIYYIFKILEMLGCNSISCTCKDSLDIGVAQTAILYGFLSLLSSKKKWVKKEMDFFLWLMYGPALLVRDRAIHKSCLKRAVMTLETIHEKCIEKREEILERMKIVLPTCSFSLRGIER